MVFQILGSRSYRQHYALIPFCNALPFNKGRTPVFSATPWITDSTTVQNIVFIAIVSILQRNDPVRQIKGKYNWHSPND